MPTERLKANRLISSAVSAGRALFVFFCILLATGLQPANSFAQEPATDDDVVRVSTDLLLFPVRIRDKQGQAVRGLTERDLLLKDDDQVTTGLYFLPGVDRVSFVFALDQSGSLREIILHQREAALALFARFGERSSIAVLRFAESSSLVAPFDNDPAAARAAFNFSAAPNQHTAIFDAAAEAVKTFDLLPRVRAERRIVILISDGLDNASKTKASTVIDIARRESVSFYIIHLPLFTPRGGQLDVRTPAKGFRDLAEKTGGRYFRVGDVTGALMPAKVPDLRAVFQAIEEDLKSQYLLGFYAGVASRDGRKHRLSLTLVPSGIEYSVMGYGYSRTHEFFLNNPGETPKRRE